MQSTHSLANRFLIAMPSMADPNFRGGVTLLCHHGSDGAMGLLLNRSSEFTLGEVLAQMGIQEVAPQWAIQPVLIGGPVEPERGFVLHSPDCGPFDATWPISDQIHLTTSRDVLEAIAQDNGPEHALIILGYAGWSASQLEGELQEDAWLTVEAAAEILFEVPISARWEAATRLLGIEPGSLSSFSGHA